MAEAGRPPKEFDRKAFEDLVGLGCTQEEICVFFRDDTGRPVATDTLTAWCKRTYGMTFQEYVKKNGLMLLRVRLRRAQLRLAERNASMAIFLGKQYLGQRDHVEYEDTAALERLNEILDTLKKEADADEAQIQPEAE
jgi:hypothetical protein